MNKPTHRTALPTRRFQATALAAAICAALAPSTFAAVATSRGLALEEVFVTAQKREQSMQDVPVAVTAVTQESLATNRIFTVGDLNGIAPNVTVRPAAGGVNLPAFSARGITSYGVAPGSDKQLSIYLDGVYLGNPRGTIFTLPDIAQMEVLRGPQGTLFGRNATAGAVSVTTRDPSGELGLKQVLDFGSNDHFRTRTTLDTPQWHGFSAYVTYLSEERDGDVENTGAGTYWDRTGFGEGTARSPKTLRETDVESWFFAARWEASDTLSVTYKYDYAEDTGTPDAQTLIFLEPEGLGGFEPLIEQIQDFNPDFPATMNPQRPSKTNNAFTLRREQETEGHSLTAVWDIEDNWTAKAIFGMRETTQVAITDISGTSGWLVGPVGASVPNLPGLLSGPYPEDARFCYICSNSFNDAEQWSAELQFNYTAERLALTFGALYFESEDDSGSPVNSAGTLSVNSGLLPADGTIPTATDDIIFAEARSFNDAESYAAYVQGEFHVLDNLDVVLGARLTRDEKSGSFRSGAPGAYEVISFDYNDTRPSYTVGVNYFLSEDVLLYGKYDSSFVSGGSAAGLEFDPEEVQSIELGLKGDFFNGRLRSNLAVFHAEYDQVQTAQTSENVPGFEGRGVVVVEGGNLEAEGVELELTALPLEGLTMGLTVGYVDTKYTEVTPLLFASVDGRPGDLYPTNEFRQALNPEWTGNISLAYASQPLFDSAYMVFSAMGIWRDDMLLQPNETKADAQPYYKAVEYSPSTWQVNARLALQEIALGDNLTGEVALWGRNLTDDDEITFVLTAVGAVTAAHAEERTYGVEFSVQF